MKPLNQNAQPAHPHLPPATKPQSMKPLKTNTLSEALAVTPILYRRIPQTKNTEPIQNKLEAKTHPRNIKKHPP
jgi:hypothetical protein